MYIDRILAPIETLGPGRRLVIWTKGCTKHCPHCANPELWDTAAAKEYSVSDIVTIIRNVYRETKFDGITISGGDPLEQKEDILTLLEQVQDLTEDILVYTGYTLEELERLWTEDEIRRLKQYISVLIDGPYIDAQNEKEIVLRGSANQRILYFKEKQKDAYEAYLSEGRKIQNVMMGDKLISVGIHNRKGECS